MKILLKILCAPMIAVLSVFVWLASKLVHQTDGILVDNEFIAEPIALSCLVICLGQVTDGHTLRTIFLTNPQWLQLSSTLSKKCE